MGVCVTAHICGENVMNSGSLYSVQCAHMCNGWDGCDGCDTGLLGDLSCEGLLLCGIGLQCDLHLAVLESSK